MFNFVYYAPTEVVFGKGTVCRTGEYVKKYGGTKALLHYGSERAVRTGLLTRVESSLEAAGVISVRLGGVVPNPRLSKVYEGIELCKKEEVDFLLAVGGGSVIDSAKAIGYGLANEGDVWDFYTRRRKAKSCMPVGAVLTISAAGSEMSDSSVITNEETREKRGCNDNLARPKFAVMDPELTLTLPPYQTAAGCADMLMHTQERYFTDGGNMEITDALAEALMRTVIGCARVLVKKPDSYKARAEVMWAGSLSHNGLTGCGAGGGDWACHRLEHELGAMFDVTHGAGLTALWPTWARYVCRNCLPRFEKYARRVMGIEGSGGEELALAGIKATENFYRDIGMPVRIRELGVEPTEAQLREMARHCALVVGGQIGSARALREEDMLRIYQAAL